MFHVKHDGDLQRLRSWLSEIGVFVDERALAKCLYHLEWVLRTNERVNLTSISDWEDGLRLHILDSLLALPAVKSSMPGTMVDLGTGGGFPGIPLALASGSPTVVVDSVAKKVTALQEYIRDQRLAPAVETFPGRSEELALQRPEFATTVVARAVAELPVLLELASPLLKMGGRLVALKASVSTDEVASAAHVAPIVGFAHVTTHEFILPGGDEVRSIISYERIGDSQVSLPRRPGMAKKRPLG